jgi:Fic family protein
VSLNLSLKILSEKYLPIYIENFPDDFQLPVQPIELPLLGTDYFSFYTSVSVVYSSKIEGEDIDLDSYMKHKSNRAKYLPNYTKKNDDLFNAYLFAKDTDLTLPNFLKAHKLLSKNLLTASSRGRIRTNPEIIINSEGRIEYEAAEPAIVKVETQKLFEDIKILLSTQLSAEETLYFASYIHLVFLKIHPFEDGNGRASRMLEKWFLAQKLGQTACQIPSERHYHQNLKEYYRNVHIGFDYENLNYERCLPLFLMLPNAK